MAHQLLNELQQITFKHSVFRDFPVLVIWFIETSLNILKEAIFSLEFFKTRDSLQLIKKNHKIFQSPVLENECI